MREHSATHPPDVDVVSAVVRPNILEFVVVTGERIEIGSVHSLLGEVWAEQMDVQVDGETKP
jgi:hypothetical protein